MKKWILTLAFIFATLPAAMAQVSNGSSYVRPGGGGTVSVKVKLNPIANDADVTYTDSVGKSPAVAGTPAETGGKAVDEADDSSTWGEDENGNTVSGGTYRVHRGKMQEKVKGKWKTLKEEQPEPTESDTLVGIGFDLDPGVSMKATPVVGLNPTTGEGGVTVKAPTSPDLSSSGGGSGTSGTLPCLSGCTLLHVHK